MNVSEWSEWVAQCVCVWSEWVDGVSGHNQTPNTNIINKTNKQLTGNVKC